MSAISLFEAFVNFLFPAFCIRCGRYLKDEDVICKNCFTGIKKEAIITENIPYIEKVFSIARYENLHDLIYQLKYFGKKSLGYKLGVLLAECMANNNFVNFDFIIPVPLHPAKKRLRGYNQSEIIAKAVSHYFKKELLNKILVRRTNTKSQTNLTKIERVENVKNAFKVKNREKIRGKSILLIDDVITTGSTLSECARMLLQNGAGKIFASTLARA